MKCPFCAGATKVMESRDRKAGDVRRTRLCLNGHKFTTAEHVYIASTGRPPANGHALRAAALSVDQRADKIKAALHEGRSVRWICDHLGVNPKTVYRWAKRDGVALPRGPEPC